MRFCHMDIEWCWLFFFIIIFYFFEEEWQASQEHGQDPLTGPLRVVVDPETR